MNPSHQESPKYIHVCLCKYALHILLLVIRPLLFTFKQKKYKRQNIQQQVRNLRFCPVMCLQLFRLLSLFLPILVYLFPLISSLSSLLSLMIWSNKAYMVQLCLQAFLSIHGLIFVKEHLPREEQNREVEWNDTEVCPSSAPPSFPVDLGMMSKVYLLKQMLGRLKTCLKLHAVFAWVATGWGVYSGFWSDSQIKVHVRMERLRNHNWLGILPAPMSLCWHPPGWTVDIAQHMYTPTTEKRCSVLIKCSCFPSKAWPAEAVWSTYQHSMTDFTKRKRKLQLCC